MKEKGSEKVIGVDIGGSHITAAELSEENFIKEDTLKRQKVDSNGSSDTIFDAWTDVLKDVIGSSNPSFVKIGVAMPGPFDYTEGISYIKDLDKYEAIYGMNVKAALSEKLHVPSHNFSFRNDAEAFLHGEVAALQVAENVKVIGVTLGTGLGSAISRNGITSDVFRAILPMHQGIAEEYISTRWFQKRYAELCGGSLKNVEALLSDPDDCLKEKLFQEFGTNLGMFLNDFSKEEEADVIIIGGNIAKCLDYFKHSVVDCLENKELRIYQSKLWEYAALVGAACSFNLKSFENDLSRHSA